MTVSPDLVGLLHRPGPRCRSLQLVGSEWSHHHLLREAFAASMRPGSLVLSFARSSGEPEPEASKQIWRWWSRAPDLVRTEFALGEEMVTAWFEGATWWSWSPSQGARTNEGREHVTHGKGPGEAMACPAPAVEHLGLELLGPTTVLGRSAHRVRARPPGSYGANFSLGRGAEEVELVVDAERGFLLRAEARFHGHAFKILEVTEVTVDPDLPVGTFVPETPDGEPFEYFEALRRLSLGELPAAVPFTVLVPTLVRSPPEMVHVRNPEPRRGIPLAAHLSYLVARPDGQHVHLGIGESAEPGATTPPPTEAWRQVGDFKVSTDESAGYLRCKVLLERAGTHVHLETTGMPLAELVELARSLVPFTGRAVSDTADSD